MSVKRGPGSDEQASEGQVSRDNESYEAPALLAGDTIIFPEIDVTISVRDSKNVHATLQALQEKNLAVVIPAPGPEGAVGSIATLVFLRKMPPPAGGGAQSMSRGLWRVRVEKVLQEEPYVRVRFTKVGGNDLVPSDGSDIMKTVFGQIDEFVRLMPGIPQEIIAVLKSRDTPGKLADMCANSPFFSFEERLDLLRTLDPKERLAKVSKLFESQLGEMRRPTREKTILDCPTCSDLADKAFDLGPSRGRDVATEFLDHVVRDHRDELMALLVARYGPTFLSRRELK